MKKILFFFGLIINLSATEGSSSLAFSWRSLSAAEAVAISEIETGLMEAVDLPIATLDYDAHWAADASSEPAPVPTRFSLKERMEGGSVFEADEGVFPELQAPAEESAGPHAEEPRTSPYDYREGFAPVAREDAASSPRPSSQTTEAV